MMSNRETGTGPIPAAINVMDVLRGVARRKTMIVGVSLFALAAGIGLVKYLKPVYSTEAQVLIQNLETPFDRVQVADNQRTDGVDDRIVASQMQVLKSADLGRRVVAALGLEAKPEFNSLINGMGTVSQIKLRLGFGEDPRLKTPEQRALDRYSDQLSIYQQPSSNVIAIKYTSFDPKIAAQVANTLAETYVTTTRESQLQPTTRARDWLAGEIANLRRKLAASEEAVEQFRAQAGLLQGATTTLGTQEISELNSQITVARTASSEARARADAIRELLQTRGSVESSSDVLASAAVQRLKEQRGEATRRVAELSATYLPNHPRMIAAQSEVASLDKQIRAEALKVVSSLEEQARVADAREKSLRASLDELKAVESTANLDDVKLKALERDVAADRALLETLLSRYAEASSRQDQSAQPGLARIIQTAGVPTAPTFPKTGPLVALITIAGLSFAIGFAFLIELMAAANRLNRRFEDAEDGEQVAAASVAATSAPVRPAMPVQAAPVIQPAWQPPPVPPIPQHLAAIPGTGSATDANMVIDAPETAAAVRQLAAWVQGIHNSGSANRIGLTSIGGNAGDTSVASLAIARHFANAGKRVAVADLSRTGSLLENLSGVSRGPGLAELVSGAADFTKVIGRDGQSTVHLLRYGIDRSPATSDLVLDRAESVLAALSRAYELVIVNLGEAQHETPVLLHKCEAALILAPLQRSSDVTSAVQALMATGLHAAGHVLIEKPAVAAKVQPDFSLMSA